jgi:Leucine-rich repeat (LRR) protein
LLLNKVTNITPLQNLTTLEDLELDENGIQNIDVLRHLTRLHTLDIIGNQITDLQALTDNEGMNFGDDIYIANNPLSATAINQQIPILEARGVTVHLE